MSGPQFLVGAAKGRRRESLARLNDVYFPICPCNRIREPGLCGTDLTLSVNAGAVTGLVP
jgi:hypothetical protein